jgi:hypothetical protein
VSRFVQFLGDFRGQIDFFKGFQCRARACNRRGLAYAKGHLTTNLIFIPLGNPYHPSTSRS